MVCMIFMVHTMHDSRCYLKMGSPRAYPVTGSSAVEPAISAATIAVSPGDWARLIADADKRGATPVVIYLQTVSFKDMAYPNLKVKMAAKADIIASELGSDAWSAGRWENGVGQFGLTVTAKGLQILRASVNAISFYPDSPWQYRTALANFDDQLSAIED